ncbi:MAG: hypothetical protein HY670_03720 [Chloroflexi bacterium]|nr:hypothetical protein [Chloroflexota bacterium]
MYTDYRENMIVDADHPILRWKANKKNERLRPSWFPVWVRSKFLAGFPYIASEHSEDVLSWNLFCSLHSIGKLGLIAEMLNLGLDIQTLYFWQHRLDQRSEQIAPEIQAVLDEMEPWGKGGARQQTETDVILRGRRHIIMVESKLGKPKTMVNAWGRSGPLNRPMRCDYLEFMAKLSVKLLKDSFDFEQDGRRFYQLFRNYLLGAALSQKWDTEFSLLTIVNSLNSNLGGRSHEEEFQSFQRILVEPGNTFFMTWQQLWRILPNEPKLSQLRRWLQSHPLLGLS